MTDAATSVLLSLALSPVPLLASEFTHAPRLELLLNGLVHHNNGRLLLTLDGMQAALPLLADMLTGSEVAQ